MERPDPVELNHFRQAPDGSTVFFPWRLTGRGYILPDEKAKRSALRMTRALYVSIFVAAGLAFAVAQQGVPIQEVDFADFCRMLFLALLFALVPLCFYVLWLLRVIYDLPPSDFHLSREELRVQALANVPRKEMRRGVLASAAMLAACLVVALVDPSHRWLGAVGILVFGGLGLFFAWILRASREKLGDGESQQT
jgi:Na+/H+ antiporter NhaD/arsenite permease-like protein